jgi:hypothetical protein
LRARDGLITSGTVSFRSSSYDGGGMRYLRFTNWLTELDRLSGPVEAIWFEAVRRHVGTIKKHATGKGNAPKQVMIDAARAHGFNPADDNEADAIAILLWAIETQGGLA